MTLGEIEPTLYPLIQSLCEFLEFDVRGALAEVLKASVDKCDRFCRGEFPATIDSSDPLSVQSSSRRELSLKAFDVLLQG